jgi:hypothetical protein
MWENPRPIYPNELYHHGIKGQRWGVRNGPPYPLGSGKVTVKYGKNRKAVNDIFNSMSDQEKIHLAGEAGSSRVPKEYVSAKEYGPKGQIMDSVVIYNGKIPVAFCDIWAGQNGRGFIAIGTRGGQAFRGKGYASKALQESIKAFNNMPQLKELDYYPHAGNIASINLAKKHGFKVFEENQYFTGLGLFKRS